jgi:hypothetical protein
MDQYEQQVWAEVQKYRERKERLKLRRLLPGNVREKAAELAEQGKDLAGELPGAEQVQAALGAALDGLSKGVMAVALTTLSERRVLDQFSENGAPLSELRQIRDLPLRESDRVFPRRRKFAYMGVGGAQGGAAGLAITVGEGEAVVGGVAGAGAGAAPGAGQIIGVIAADAAASLVVATRIVAETGMYYGYDPLDPQEQVIIAAILSMASAETEGGKLVTYREFNNLVQGLARSATWEQLGRNQITKVVARVYRFLGERLTKKSLGKAVPVLGIAFGAGMNMQLAHRVADEAYYSYRERRLRDGGDPPPEFPSPAAWPEAPVRPEDFGDIQGLLEGAAETDDAIESDH